MELVLGDLARELGGLVDGDPGRVVSSVAPLESAGPGALSFFANRRYKKEYLATKAGAVLVAPADHDLGRPPGGASILVVDNPYLVFAKVAARFYQPPRPPPGVDPRAAVEASAEIDPTATVMPFAYVGRGVHIGARTVIHAGCVLLDSVRVGADSLLYPAVVVREGCTLGERTVVQPGAVIGGDGFGFAFDPEAMRHVKGPQVGAVRIDDDVEIGANTCIDRGGIDDTVVGTGAKIDNLVQVGHNVEVGPLVLMAGASAVAGSTKLGMGVVLGGQVGVINHLVIGDGARVAAKSAVFGDIPAGEAFGGYPAQDQKKWLREQAALRQLPDLLRELRELRKRIEDLEKRET